jgi:hypothetical protein
LKSNKSFDISNSFNKLDFKINYDSSKITKKNLGFGLDLNNMNMHMNLNLNNNILNNNINTELINNNFNNILNPQSININTNNNNANSHNHNNIHNHEHYSKNYSKKIFSNFPSNINNVNRNYTKIIDEIPLTSLPRNNNLLMSSDEDEKLKDKNINKGIKNILNSTYSYREGNYVSFLDNFNKEKNTNSIFCFDKVNDKERKNKLKSLFEKVAENNQNKIRLNEFTSIDRKLDQINK